MMKLDQKEYTVRDVFQEASKQKAGVHIRGKWASKYDKKPSKVVHLTGKEVNQMMTELVKSIRDDVNLSLQERVVLVVQQRSRTSLADLNKIFRLNMRNVVGNVRRMAADIVCKEGSRGHYKYFISGGWKTASREVILAEFRRLTRIAYTEKNARDKLRRAEKRRQKAMKGSSVKSTPITKEDIVMSETSVKWQDDLSTKLAFAIVKAATGLDLKIEDDKVFITTDHIVIAVARIGKSG